MPHQIIEYSDNLNSKFDIEELVEVMHNAASEVDAFPLGGLRTRAVARSVYQIADNHPDNGFVHVVMRIAQGRDAEVKKAVGKHLFATLCAFLHPTQANSPLAISYELQEIEVDFRWNRNNLREHMAERSA